MSSRDLTYCASPCRNEGCPRHQVNAPDGWRIVYAELHRQCDEFLPYDPLTEETGPCPA
jgi:hypothetical protein